MNNKNNSFTYGSIRFSPCFAGSRRAAILDDGSFSRLCYVRGCPSWWFSTNCGHWYTGSVTLSGKSCVVSAVENICNA